MMGPIVKKWHLIGLSEEEEMVGWGFIDLIFTLVLGVSDLSSLGFSCKKWTV